MLFILEYEPVIRLVCFFSIFLFMATFEVVLPRRVLVVPKLFRWTHNLAILLVDIVVVRLLFPMALVGVAMWAETQQWGVLHYVSRPLWLCVLLSVVLLDLAVWCQHVLMHKVPLLWRFHRMHHADQDIDVTTGLRFHPLEILFSVIFKSAVVVALGAPVFAVLVFEILLNASSMFNHSNIRLPDKIDAVLRCFIVTPDMHRVHHSWVSREMNSNFGFNLPWWDRLFATYCAQPQDGHTEMTIGLQQFRRQSDLRVDQMLVQPLR